MSEERLKFLGRRGELELKIKNLELRIEALVKGMREELDPMKEATGIRTDLIVSLGLELAETCDRLREALSDLKKIQEILGR
jgi:hypothetical protein